MLVRKANAVEEGTKRAAWLYHQHNQSIHATDGMTVTSLSAVATDCLRQIALNWKLWQKFEKWCKFSSRVKAKSHRKKSCKARPACKRLTREIDDIQVFWDVTLCQLVNS
jgi:hypothetical protein